VLLIFRTLYAPHRAECASRHLHRWHEPEPEHDLVQALRLSCVEGALTVALALVMQVQACVCITAAHAVSTTRKRIFPADSEIVVHAVEGATRRLKYGWRQHATSDGRVFFSHTKSGRVQWDPPAELDLAALDTVPESPRGRSHE